MTAKEQFMQRFREAKERDGLVDMKFFVDKPHELSEEELYAALVEFDEAAKDAIDVDLDALEENLPRHSESSA